MFPDDQATEKLSVIETIFFQSTNVNVLGLKHKVWGIVDQFLEELHAPFVSVQPEWPQKQGTPFPSSASAVIGMLCCVMITALVSLDPILILQDYVYTRFPHTVGFS